MARLLRLNLLAVAALLYLGVCAPATQAQQLASGPVPNPLPRYVISPPSSAGDDNTLCRREMFDNPDQWKEGRAMSNAMLFANKPINAPSDELVRSWLTKMKQWNLKLELEVGAIKEWAQTGQDAFKKQKANWERIQRLGGTIYSMAFDEPLICIRKQKEKPDEYAVEQTAEFIALLRKAYPHMLLGDIEPYPSIPLADHIKWIDALQKQLAKMGVRGMDFYRLDVNWVVFAPALEGSSKPLPKPTGKNIPKGSWHEVKKLEDYCRSIRLPFSLIYWTPVPYFRKLNNLDESVWYDGVMAMGNAYAAVGGRPDQYVMESWVSSPSHGVPETSKEAFTGAVRDFGRKFIPGMTAPAPVFGQPTPFPFRPMPTPFRQMPTPYPTPVRQTPVPLNP